MPAARTTRTRRDDVSRFILTSLAISLLIHVLIVHYLGSIRLFDVEVFTSAVSRWFHVVDVPDSLPPELATTTRQLPPQAETVETPKPIDIPLINPTQHIASPSFADSEKPVASPHKPSGVRLPDTELPVVHTQGAPDVDQTLTQIGDVAPVRTTVGAAVGVSGTGGREVLRATSGIPSGPPVAIDLIDLKAPLPASDTHAGDVASPTAKPTPAAVELGGPEPQGIAIPLTDAIAHKETLSPPVVILPQAFSEEEEDTRPIIPLAADEVKVKVDMYERPGEPHLYFRLEIAAAAPDKLPIIPKDVVFICDVSLSMRRSEIQAARDAIEAYIRRLRSTDRFNVVVFSEEARKLFPDFAQPTPERAEAAARFVDRIPGQVKTDVYRVLRSVVQDVAQQSVRNRPTTIFFVSDGRSTSGIRDARRIVNEIGAYAKPNFAILPFDAGSGTDRYLLDLLAYRSRGQSTFADDRADAPAALEGLFAAYDNPVLMQLRLIYTNLDVAETYPAFLPNLYADQPIVLYGRCKPGQNVTIQLQGKNPYARRALRFSYSPGAPDATRNDIAREWARRKIHHIVSDMARVGETKELKTEIERVGRTYDVRTPYNR